MNLKVKNLDYQKKFSNWPLCVVDLWCQANVCHGNLKENEQNEKSVLDLILLLVSDLIVPRHQHSIFQRFASESALDLEEKWGIQTLKETWLLTHFIKSESSFHQPWKPRLMKCCAHCTFSAPIFWSTCKFWNIHIKIITEMLLNESKQI